MPDSSRPTPRSDPDRRTAFIDAARAMVPALRARAAEAERTRAIPADTHHAFRDAGFYRLFQPARYGGFEMDLGLMVDVAAELGRGCGSSVWIFTNLASQGWINGMKTPAAQEELWADDPDALIASSFPGRDAEVRLVDGGIVVKGTWHFSSGVDFARWNHLQIFLKPEGGPPEHRFALIPDSDFTVIDDWFSNGLAGTGSRSIRIEEAFIPDYRTLNARDIAGGPSPGSTINASPLFRMPFFGVGGKLFSGPALGIARGALEMIETDIAGRSAVSGVRLAEQQSVHLRIAEAGAEIDAAWALLLRDCVESRDAALEGAPVDLLRRARWRRNNAYAIQLCVRAVERLFPLAGMRGLVPDDPVQRAWRDVHACAAQVAIAWDPQAANYGRARFGLPFNDPRA